MKLHERLEYLSYLCRYQSTYYEMKYYLKEILKGKSDTYFKKIGHYDRSIGKSAALARLSAKYGIPVIVSTQAQKLVIEKDIPRNIPKYFKRSKPTAIVVNADLRGKRYDVLLAEEGLNDECLGRALPVAKCLVGYRSL